jgi:hypothetical protein
MAIPQLNQWLFDNRDRLKLLNLMGNQVPLLNFLADNLSLKPKSQTEALADEEREIGFNYGQTKTAIKRNAGDADFKLWLSLPTWTPEQAVCLIYEINPLEYCNIKDNQQVEVLRIHAAIKGNMTPYQWQQFGIEQKIPLPKPIMDVQPPLEKLQPEAVADDGAVKPKSEQATELKQKARELGEKWMNQQRNEGKDPGVIDIAKYVETEFKKLDIRGKRDDYLSWETIKKEFLTGITGKSPNGKGLKKRKQTGDSPV